MLRLHSYISLCLPLRGLCSAYIVTYHYVYYPVTYAPPPSYLSLCLPFHDISSASIAIYHYVCHSGTYALPSLPNGCVYKRPMLYNRRMLKTTRLFNWIIYRYILYLLSREEVWVHKSIVLPLHYFIKIPVLSQAVIYLCVSSTDFASISRIFLLDFGTVPTTWYIFFRDSHSQNLSGDRHWLHR
jgi:hypothetical protein